MIISTRLHRDTDCERPLGSRLVSLPKSGVLKNSRTRANQIALIIKQTTITKDDKDDDADNLSSSAVIPRQDLDGAAGYHGTL